MLNSDTKRHIDAARDVLVGVAPNPTTQIDQITYALIYKFMDDMDQAAIKAGGEPSFFINDLEQFAWSALMNSRKGNQEKMDLYSEALTKFSEAKQLPELFRTIFRAAFLPYRSPETLGLFLKEISYFDYTHPEELGNAYEYLLSIMSSQGDAGQFRTPRHIIDFIVDVINPTKDDRVLDPACGTGGFLVSTYNHILEQHDGKDEPKNKEKPLTPDERKKLMSNLQGYDIDPTMVRIAQVNMYLHQFKNPQIFQYDPLTSEERWNDKYEVILANPPFMSPKGGIKPHNKFGVVSNRAEVLFIDYIINHLKPKGRAGILVPEGITSQSGKAYKELRKNLVEHGLLAVVSLPSGVFQPYSGVKTSILFIDNELAKQKTEIAFLKISADGFDLGATKRVVSQNDLPIALNLLKSWVVGETAENTMISHVSKDEISSNGDYNLSADVYKAGIDDSDSNWPIVKLGDICKSITPPKKIPSSQMKESGKYQVIDQSQNAVAGWTDDETALVNPGRGVLIFGDHTCATKFVTQQFAQGADGIKILEFDDSALPKYVFHLLQANPIESDGYKRHFGKLKSHSIPLPPLDVQEQIVTELDGYAAIVSEAKQSVKDLVETYEARSKAVIAKLWTE
jgi:type I restriction enzyme M protein